MKLKLEVKLVLALAGIIVGCVLLHVLTPYVLRTLPLPRIGL